jgi:hypothetical protein
LQRFVQIAARLILCASLIRIKRINPSRVPDLGNRLNR